MLEVKMSEKEQFFGKVEKGSYLIFAPERLKGVVVSLTTVPPKGKQAPELNTINLSEYEGKIIEVNGINLDAWIYSATVVEEAGPVLSDFLMNVFCKGEGKQKRCALVVGHKSDSPGTENSNTNVNEFDFNNELVCLIEKKVRNTRIYRIYRRTYAALPVDINEVDPDFIICLHCNSYDGKASGTRVLYYHKSKQGQEIASILQKKLMLALRLPNRGIQPNTAEDKGGYLLRYTNATCVIAEPFFIDNDSDLETAKKNLERLAEAYAAAIDEISQTVTFENRTNRFIF
jgi:N-acetylmuramoyl-L-alanine amidase